MSGGFWAGAVPPWAYVVGACLWIFAVLIGAWYGYGRGWKHAEEEVRWAREQAKTRRTHPVYRAWPGGDNNISPPVKPGEIAHVEWLAHEELLHEWHDHAPLKYGDEAVAGCLACERRWETVPNGQAVTTGEIQAITDEMDAWLATHVYAAPRDYGEWLEREDRHAAG